LQKSPTNKNQEFHYASRRLRIFIFNNFLFFAAPVENSSSTYSDRVFNELVWYDDEELEFDEAQMQKIAEVPNMPFHVVLYQSSNTRQLSGTVRRNTFRSLLSQWCSDLPQRHPTSTMIGHC
jgi:hypothetical protein